MRDAAIATISSRWRHYWIIGRGFHKVEIWGEVYWVWCNEVELYIGEVLDSRDIKAGVGWKEVKDDVDWGGIELVSMSWDEVEVEDDTV